MTSVSVLRLADLKKGLPGVNPPLATAHLHACLVCLDENNHVTDVSMKVRGIQKTEYNLIWTDEVTDQIKRSWNDEQDATEDGAAGLAFLLILDLTNYTIIKRSRKGTGFDYWLGYKDNTKAPFQNTARLEVSGILKTDRESIIKSRVKQKLKQTRRTDNMGLPAYVVVVEFSRPVAHVVKK